MSKGRVWNRGKHNGAGLSKKKTVEQEPTDSTASSEISSESTNESSVSRIDVVKPMNRTNWVSRPKRVINKDSQDKQ